MWEALRVRLSYANVTATVALIAALGGLAAGTRNAKDAAPPAAPAGMEWWYLAGSWNELPQCNSCEVSLPVSGSGSFGSTQNTGNDLLSPSAAIVASNLSVEIDKAPGGSAKRVFALYARSSAGSSSLRCDVIGASTTCNSGTQTLTIPAGSAILVDAANLGNAPATKVRFSWRAVRQ